MLNLEKHLDDIKIEHKKPSQKLIDDTIFEIHKLNGRKGINWDWLFNIKTLAAFSLSVATLLIMLVINFNTTPVDVGSPVHAFYSVDINPSVIISVNEKEEVISIEALNDDAKVILEQAELIGLHSREAITRIVDLAKTNGYITDENKYVLIGRFGSDNGAIVPEMQEYFEDNFEGNVQVLIVTGSMDDKEQADKQEVSPGLLELSNAVNSETPDGEDDIENILEGANEDSINLPAVELSLEIDENIFTFNFNKLSFEEDEYEGTIVYKLIRAKTIEEIQDLDYELVLRRTYYSTEELPTSFEIEALLREYHYAIVVEYEGGVKKFSNIVYLEPERFVDDAPKYIEGVAIEKNLKLVWTKAQGDEFTGYRVVASKENENPKYPDVESIILITDINTTQLIIEPGQYGLEDGTEYNFSVTYMYNEDTQYANAVALTTGSVEEEPDPEPDPDPTPTPVVRTKADLISSELDGYKVYLNWHKIEKSSFKGYKVVYSFTDSTPKYGDSGSHYYTYITDRSKTNSYIDLSKIAYKNTTGSEKIYISITALYNDEPSKVAGNVKVHNIPEALLEVEEPIASNIVEHDLRENYDVFLEWEQIDLLSLEGYKVVYSFTDETPKYGDSGTHYKYWITNHKTTEATINLEDIIGKNTTGSNVVYFSITSLYNNHSVRKPGNTVMIEIPVALREEEPEEPITPTIREHALQEGNKVFVAWNGIELNSLEGYKVVYSFTDTTPSYDESGSHTWEWIPGKETLNETLILSEMMSNYSGEGTKVYIAITAIYSDFSVKKTSDAITINIPESLMPEPEPDPEPGTATTILSANKNEAQTQATIVVEEITNPRFTKHKLYYSFTDSSVSDGTFYDNMTGSSMNLVFADLIEKPEGASVVYVRVTTLYGEPLETFDSNVFTIELPTE